MVCVPLVLVPEDNQEADEKGKGVNANPHDKAPLVEPLGKWLTIAARLSSAFSEDAVRAAPRPNIARRLGPGF